MKFMSSLRIDVTLAFLAVMLAGALSYFPATVVVAVFVSVLAQRWGAPPGSSLRALTVRTCFFLALWFSGGVCGSLLGASVSGEAGIFGTVLGSALVLMLAPYALRFLSGRVNSWWAPQPPATLA